MAILMTFSAQYDRVEDWDCYFERFELYLQTNRLEVSSTEAGRSIIICQITEWRRDQCESCKRPLTTISDRK